MNEIWRCSCSEIIGDEDTSATATTTAGAITLSELPADNPGAPTSRSTRGPVAIRLLPDGGVDWVLGRRLFKSRPREKKRTPGSKHYLPILRSNPDGEGRFPVRLSSQTAATGALTLHNFLGHVMLSGHNSFVSGPRLVFLTRSLELPTFGSPAGTNNPSLKNVPPWAMLAVLLRTASPPVLTALRHNFLCGPGQRVPAITISAILCIDRLHI